MKLSHIFTHDMQAGKLFNIPDQPINIMLDVTTYCNNRCLFCYNPLDSTCHDDTTDADSLKRIVSLIGSQGTREILYLGGEPFSFPFMRELLGIGKKFSVFQRAISNGAYIKDKGTCLDLKDCGLDEVGISFHSSRDAIHDKLSGRKGSFRDALLAIENCLGAGISTFIQYSPTRLNSIHDIIELAEKIKTLFGNGMVCFDINRLLPLGHGSKAESVFLDGDDWFNFLCEASALYQYGYDVHAELTPFCWLEHKAEMHGITKQAMNDIIRMNRGCFMWVAQLALDHKGRIKFCPAGSFVGPSILDINWPDFWKNWVGFERYRSFLWNDCCVNFDNQTACSYFYHCLGGCKYSKGTHYEVDRYAIKLCKINDRRSTYEKTCGAK